MVAGQTVNSIGGWASAIVLWGFAAYRFNASPGAVSVTIICWAAPPALLSPLLGVSIDRIGPKAATVTGYLGAAGAALGLAAAGSLTELAIAAVGYGCARALAGPAPWPWPGSPSPPGSPAWPSSQQPAQIPHGPRPGMRKAAQNET